MSSDMPAPPMRASRWTTTMDGSSLRFVTMVPGAGTGRGPDSGTGHGITGMRERAEALGGSLSAGPSSDGGFLVTANLPVGSDRPR